MDYNRFYKQAKDGDPKWTDTMYGEPGEDGKPTGYVEGYNEQLPMLALLAGTGALGGYALSGKKHKRRGALIGGLSLPAAYLAYVASLRNGILPIKDDILDSGAHTINAWGNTINPLANSPEDSSEEGNA